MGQRLRDVSEGSIFQRGQSLDGFDLAQAVARGGRIPFSSLPMMADTSHRVVLNILAVANAQFYIDAGFGNFTSLQTNIPGGAQVGDRLCATNGTITFEFFWAGSAFGAILGDIINGTLTPSTTDITTADGTWSVIRRGGEVTVASGIEFQNDEVFYTGLINGDTTMILGLDPDTNQLIITTPSGEGGEITAGGIAEVGVIVEGGGVSIVQTRSGGMDVDHSVTINNDLGIQRISLITNPPMNDDGVTVFRTGGAVTSDIYVTDTAVTGTEGLTFYNPSSYVVEDDQHNGNGAMIVTSPFLKLYETSTTDGTADTELTHVDTGSSIYVATSSIPLDRDDPAQLRTPDKIMNLGVQALRFDGDDFNITQTLDGTDPVIGDYTITSNVGGLTKVNFSPPSASDLWVINHNLDEMYPVITVYDSAGQVVLPMQIGGTSEGRTHDANTITITFPIAVAGHATLIG